MVIEAGVVAGYVVAWAVRKVRRAAGRFGSAGVKAHASIHPDQLDQCPGEKVALAST